MSALAAARPLRETITVGASIGVALGGGGVLVVDRAEPKYGAKPRAWCAQHARAAITNERWRGVDCRAYVVETTLDEGSRRAGLPRRRRALSQRAEAAPRLRHQSAACPCHCSTWERPSSNFSSGTSYQPSPACMV